MTDKKILSGVPFGDKIYSGGMEEELEAVLTKEQLNYLTERGAISGFGGKAVEPKPLAKMNKAELVAEAERLGVSVTPDSMTNKQIIEAIEAI